MNEKHLNKIQKCFDLAKSGNVHEAANALAMAQKLMKKYGMSDEDIRHPLFVGVKYKAMTAAYAFDVVYRQLKIARRDYLKTLHPRLLMAKKQ